jgi:hypothetical protein
MDTLYSIDEHRKTRQKEYEDLSEEIQLHKHAKNTQPRKPGLVMRIAQFGWKFSVAVLGKLRNVKNQVVTVFQRSSAETKRI